MNKIGLAVMLALGGGIYTTASLAVENVALTKTDASLKEFQRRVMLMNPSNGYEATTFSLPVTYCPLNAKECISRGVWTFSLPEKQIATDTENLAKWVGLKRFDQISLTANAIDLVAPYGRIHLDNGGKELRGGVMPFDAFRADFESVLATRAPQVSQVLAEGVRIRAKSLRDKEEGTAMTGSLKSLGLDRATLEKMMDDGFAFANYVYRPNGKVTISEVKKKNYITGAEYIAYSVNVDLPVSTKMLTYHFDANTSQFALYKEWTGESGSFVSESAEYDAYPTHPEQITNLVTQAYSVSYKAAVLHLSTLVKRDDNFTLATKVTGVTGNQFQSNLHAGLDLRADSLWTMGRSIDGEKKQIGLGKTRQVAVAPKEGEETYSDFANIKGAVEQGDQLTEFPWTGVQANVGAGMIAFDISDIGGKATTTGQSQNFMAAQAGVAMDLGYLLNSPELADVWVTSDLVLGTGGSEVNTTKTGKFTPSILYGVNVAAGKSFFMGTTGVSVTPSLGIGYGGISGSTATTNTGSSNSISLSELTLKPTVAVDYTLDNFSLIRASLEYPVQLSNSASVTPTSGGTKTDLVDNKFGQGLTLFVSYRWNLDSIGSMSKYMK